MKAGNLFSGNLFGGTNTAFGLSGKPVFQVQGEHISQKKDAAAQKAGIMVKRQFARDNDMADSLKELRDKTSQISKRMNELDKSYKETLTEKEALKASYGIEEDSQEQKDLMLLEKAGNSWEMEVKMGLRKDLSAEEILRLKTMGPLTEYQSRALELKDQADTYEKMKSSLETANYMLNIAISDVKKGLLKQDGMSKVLDAADAILQNASEEVVSMLMDTAKKHIDEEAEKLREDAEEAAKKEVEKEAKEAKKEERAANEEMDAEEVAVTINKLDGMSNALQTELDKLIREIKLIDSKGSLVDSSL